MQFKREISSNFNTLANEFPVIVVTGARQVGKTTLLQNLLPAYNYVSLDLPSVAHLAEKNPDLFLQKYPTPLIIDEVQYAPGIFKNLKVWIDKNRNKKGQIILTGSQKFNLMKGVTESLAGRAGFLELEPLSIHELQSQIKLNNNEIPLLLERGFFPELWKEQTRSANNYYHAYLNTYLEKDLLQLLQITNLYDFERFLRLLATRVAQTLEISTLASEVGVKVNTLKSWISVLEASNQIIFLQPYFANFGSRLVKSPKFYFSDVGLCCFLLGLNSKAVIDSPLIGALWENLVFCELRKRNLCLPQPGQFWYYRDHSANEVDLLYTHNGKMNFIEIKWTTKPEEKVALKMQTIASKFRSKALKLGSLSIFCRSQESYNVTEKTGVANIFDATRG